MAWLPGYHRLYLLESYSISTGIWIILFGLFLPYSRLCIPVARDLATQVHCSGEDGTKRYRLEPSRKGGGVPVPDLRDRSRLAPAADESREDKRSI